MGTGGRFSNTFEDNDALLPQPPLAGLVDVPVLVGCERLGHNHAYDIVGGRFCLKVYGDVRVLEARGAEGRAAGNAGQFAGAVGKQPVTIAEQQVENAPAGVAAGKPDQSPHHFFHWRMAVTLAAQVIEDVAEQGLTVGTADRFIKPGAGSKPGELPIVGKRPVAPPEFPHERMGVSQAH